MTEILAENAHPVDFQETTELGRVSFNLVDQPWIQVRYLDGRVAEVSMVHLFREAAQISQLLGELPTQGFAILRVLLAILYRSLDEDYESAEDWHHLWQDGLPIAEIESYLERHRHRFDLLDPNYPFFQVSDLHTSKNENKELSLLILDVPSNNRLFTTRAGSGLESLSFAEAARWLVNAQAFDYSGIKSGAVGDNRVKNGKGYGIGVGLAGRLGGIFLAGQNLNETLLLNLVKPREASYDAPDDLPPWEKTQLGAAEEKPNRLPTGPIDIYTWQNRRIRLFFDAHSVRRCLVSNGDKIDTVDLFDLDPMTSWRRSAAQEKNLGRSPVYAPAEHNPARLFWRGISALLPKKLAIGDIAQTVPPGVIRWISELWAKDYLPRKSFISLRAVGVLYPDQNNSTVGEIFDDRLDIALSVLAEQDSELATQAENAVKLADEGVQALKFLAMDLAAAAGGSGEGQRQRTEEEAYAALDWPYRNWLRRLGSDTDVSAAAAQWREIARKLINGLAGELLDASGKAAWIGREVNDHLLNTSLAELKFKKKIRRIFGANSIKGFQDE